MSKKKKRVKKAIIFIIIALIIVCVVLYFLLFNNNGNGFLTKSVDKTEKFDYTLDRNNTNLMKENFNDLKSILSSDQIDYDKYAEVLSKLFIIDLYTIDNKENMYDVGSLEYVYDKENFKNRVQSTLYKYLKEKSVRKNNEYPIVESISISGKEKSTFTYDNTKYDSDVITLNWTYKKDLGYDDEGKVEIIKIDDKLYVVSFTPEAK